MTKQGNASQANAGESTTGKTWAYENEVSYPFGFGLEGSTFAEEITDVNIDWSGEGQSSVTVKVTNTGDTAAKHAVQLYVSLPYTDYDRANGVEKSAIQLIGYAKTGEAQEASFRDVVLLAPAESEDVTVTFNAQDLYTYDRTYEHDGVKGAWTLEAGDYWFATGNGAHEAVNAVLAGMGFSAEAETDARKETVDDERTITESNDTIVQNELDDADLNSWGVEVQYLTRNDWLNTFPKSVDSLSATENMIVYLRNVFYDASAEKASYDGPESFSYGADNGVKAIQLMGLDFDDPLYDQVLDELTL